MSSPIPIPEEERTLRFSPGDLPEWSGDGPMTPLDTDNTEVSVYQPADANPALADDIIYYSDTEPMAETPDASAAVAEPVAEEVPAPDVRAEAAPVEDLPAEPIAAAEPFAEEVAAPEAQAEAAPVEDLPSEPIAAAEPIAEEVPAPEIQAEAEPVADLPPEPVLVAEPNAEEVSAPEVQAEAAPVEDPPSEPIAAAEPIAEETSAPMPIPAASAPFSLHTAQDTWGEIVRREVGVPADSVPTRVAYVDTWEEIVQRGGAAAHAEPPRLDAVPLGIPVADPEPAERVPVPEILLAPTPEQEAWGEIVRREPGIAADAVRPLAPADLASSPAYVEMGSRLGQSAEIVDRYSPDRLRFLARDLTAALEASLKAGKLDALMVATDDGLVIAESRRMDRGEVLAAISTLCESIATRLQRESLIQSIEEMSIRGERGEQIIVRYFPGLGQRYFLLGFSRKHVPYRRAMTVTVHRCSDLLRQHFPGQGPADKPNPEEST